MSIPATSLHATLAHAIAYLIRPLILSSYPTTTVIKLQLMLEANLTPLYAPTWVPHDPSRGSGRRCLSLSPYCLPPRAIYSACLSAGVQWFDWIALLGGREFDFFVDPASISVRYGSKSGAPLFTIWSGDESHPPFSHSPIVIADHTKLSTTKTYTQQALEDDDQSDDELFAMLADEISVPTWMTPTLDQFPIPARPISPFSDISQSSQSSSDSDSDSYSFPDHSCNVLPAGFKLAPATDHSRDVKLSHRKPSRRVFVDISKTTVTPYDGGKTTVLTGGVMLGGASKLKDITATRVPRAPSHGWRFNML